MSSLLPIYCFAPSGKTPDQAVTAQAFELLQSQGLTVHNVEVVERSYQRFAGTDQERTNEINDLINITQSLGPSVALAIRGGYGLTRILPQIDWNHLAQAVDQGLKIVGHSDITALELALFAKTGRASFAGPMLNADFGKSINDVSAYTLSSFKKLLQLEPFSVSIEAQQPFLTIDDYAVDGVLWGGNLSMLVSLLGTPYFPDLSRIQQGILFIEDVNEHPYRVERMLFQLFYAGILGAQSAILVGDFSNYKESPIDEGYTLESCLSRIKSALQGSGAKTQILKGLPFGHCNDKLTLPMGTNVHFKANASQFSLQTI